MTRTQGCADRPRGRVAHGLEPLGRPDLTRTRRGWRGGNGGIFLRGGDTQKRGGQVASGSLPSHKSGCSVGRTLPFVLRPEPLVTERIDSSTRAMIGSQLTLNGAHRPSEGHTSRGGTT